MDTRGPRDQSRRDFARLFALGGSAAFFASQGDAWPLVEPEQAPSSPDERYWQGIRNAFIMPAGDVYLNAANLCPSPTAVLTATDTATRSVDADPSNQNRTKTRDGREATRFALAAMLRVSPAEIVITRNTSELHQALYEKDQVVCATRPSTDRGGLRFSPHFYNLETDVKRAVAAVRRYVTKGV